MPRGLRRFSALPFLMCLGAAFATAQGTTCQVDLGIAASEYHWSRWGGELHHPLDEAPIPMLALGVGATRDMGPGQWLRLQVSAAGGELYTYQVSADWQWALFRRGNREIYGLLGPSLNFMSGRYTFHSGYDAPDGDGVHRQIHQNWRPGFKAGAGFQWSKHWAVEVDAHVVSMATSGDQGVPQSLSGYVEVVAVCRF